MIPKNWNKVTLEKYAKIQETLKLEPRNELERFDLQVERMCYLLGITIPEALANCTTDDFAKLQKLIAKPLPTRLMLSFRFKGVHYRPKRAEEINGGSYAAIMNLAKNTTFNNLNQIMFNIVQPYKFGFKKSFPFIGWNKFDYKADEVEKVVKDFKELPMEIVNPVSVFFLRVSKELTNHLHEELVKKMEKMNNTTLEALSEITDGYAQ